MTFNLSKYSYQNIALKNKTEIDQKCLKKPVYKENIIAKFFFSKENWKKGANVGQNLKNSFKNHIHSFKMLLQNYTQKRTLKYSKIQTLGLSITLKKSDNKGTGKKVQMQDKNFNKLF